MSQRRRISLLSQGKPRNPPRAHFAGARFAGARFARAHSAQRPRRAGSLAPDLTADW